MAAASLAAGLYTGLATFLDAAAFATVVFVPAGLPFDVGIQHALIGFVLMQATVCLTSGAGNIVTPVSYEVMPFLAKMASLIAASGAKARTQILPTVLASSMLISAAAAIVCALLARLLPAKFDVESLLPPPLQAGLFSAIGWGLYTLSYETLGLENMPFDPSIATWTAARLWLPAHVLGIGLWLASRRTSSPALFPGFVVGVTLLTHAVRLGTGTSLAEAQASHWLMASCSGQPMTALLSSAYSVQAIEWDVLLRADVLKEMICALLFGPLVNTLLNLVLIGPVIGIPVSLSHELGSHAAGYLSTALGGGYSNYIAVSNTVIHRKCGGKDMLSCLAAAAVALTFLVVYPLFEVVGYVPTLVVAAICVYIGVDFLWDNLVENGVTMSAMASWAVLGLCLAKDMLWGVMVGVAAFQAYGLLYPKAAKGKAKGKAE